jgi:antitoxin PrlF
MADASRSATLARAEPQEDPAIDRFLDFLADDLKARPEAVKALSPDLAARIAALTAGVSVDLDAEIVGDVSL